MCVGASKQEGEEGKEVLIFVGGSGLGNCSPPRVLQWEVSPLKATCLGAWGLGRGPVERGTGKRGGATSLSLVYTLDSRITQWSKASWRHPGTAGLCTVVQG